MHDFTADPARPKPEFYRELLDAADALTAGEPDGVANMANLAALVWQLVPDLNWAGFYRRIGDELVLGQRVADVHAFPGHIACDAASRSELVVPVLREGAVIAVIDLDSPQPGRFDENDQDGFEALAARIAARI